jgi:hypothetical protein
VNPGSIEGPEVQVIANFSGYLVGSRFQFIRDFQCGKPGSLIRPESFEIIGSGIHTGIRISVKHSITPFVQDTACTIFCQYWELNLYNFTNAGGFFRKPSQEALGCKFGNLWYT